MIGFMGIVVHAININRVKKKKLLFTSISFSNDTFWKLLSWEVVKTGGPKVVQFVAMGFKKRRESH